MHALFSKTELSTKPKIDMKAALTVDQFEVQRSGSQDQCDAELYMLVWPIDH